HYSGDDNKNGDNDEGDTAEQRIISAANPSITTTASPSFTLGTTAPTLSDSAVLAGGYFETGTITFTLTGPGGFSYTQTDMVNGKVGRASCTERGKMGEGGGDLEWKSEH